MDIFMRATLRINDLKQARVIEGDGKRTMESRMRNDGQGVRTYSI